MSKKYYYSDVDGTIMVEELREVPEETCKAIKEFQHKSNHSFSLCSGRSVPMLEYLIEKLEIKKPIISSNGAVIYDPISKKVLKCKVLKTDIVETMFENAKKFNLNIILETDKGVLGIKDTEIINFWIINKKQDKYKNLELEIFENTKELIDFFRSQKLMVLKIQLTTKQDGTNYDLDQIKNELKNSNVDIVVSTERNIDLCIFDVSPLNVSKALAIKEVASILKIDYKDIVVFGDNINDFEMIKQANLGIAVGNARDKIKKIANKIIDSVENHGVAKYLKEL